VNSEEVDSKKVNKAIAYACRLLSMRDYSQHRIKQKMLSKGYLPSEITQAVDYLNESDYLNELRFCESFIRSRVQKGQGEKRIKLELKAQGLNETCFGDFFNSINWQEVCNKSCLKKLKTLDVTEIHKSRLKLQRFLSYRGFTREQISLSIKQHFNNNG